MKEEGTSEVIGTVLLVLITITLASILALFLFNVVDEKIDLMRNVLDNFQRVLENSYP